MRWTQKQYDDLSDAIASGAASISYTSPGESKAVTFRGLDAMLALHYKMGLQLGLEQPVTDVELTYGGR